MQPIILLVEGHPALRQALRPWIGSLFPQCRVITACTGASGIRAARTHKPHIVVIDVRLSCMNGIEAARRIKARAPDTDIVMFTLCDAQAYRTAANRAGACGYVLKQRSQADLPPLLERLLDAAANRQGRPTAHPVTPKNQ